MSFFVTPSERESGEILGGGNWANEYSYKNPNTGEWEYTNSPRTYGNNGDMTYDEWMKSLGRTPGSYGASAADTLYNEWLKRVTPDGKGRMNGMGEFIVGTKPNEATTSKASQLGESTSVSANEESLSTSEDKGTDYSWVTAATEEAIPEKESESSNGMSKEDLNDYYAFAYGMTHDTPFSLDDKGEKKPYYYGDWSDKSGDGGKADSNYKNYLDIIAPLEMETAWNEANERNKALLAKQEDLNNMRNKIKNIGAVLENTKQPEGFQIGSIFGKTIDDYMTDWQKAAEAYKAVDNEENQKAYNLALSKMNAAVNIQKKIADSTLNDVIEYLNENPKAKAKDLNNKKFGDVTVRVSESSDKNTISLVLTDKSGLEAEIGDINVEGGRKGRLTSESLIQKTEEFKKLSDNKISEVSKAVEEFDKSRAPIAPAVPETPTAPIAPTIPTAPTAPIEPEVSEPETPTEPVVDKPTVTKFETLTEVKEELGKVDIEAITNEKEAQVANEKITALTKNAVEIANRDFVTIYKELVRSGVQAKDLANNPRVKQFSQEAFVIGQDIYERASELEAKTNELGLTNLDKKYIKKNLDEISIKVGQLDPEKNKAVGSYYSPGSNMNGTNTSQPTGINLSKEEVKSLADYANDIQSTKDAGLAIMKSAAFNGAENVEGGKYVEEWKNAKALETVEGFKTLTKDEWKNKLTWKDYFAAGAKGTLGTAVAILGGAVTAANPVLGILLMTVGTASATKAGLQITTDVVRSKSTNKEMMFGSGEGGKDVFRDIYNRSLESANIGDAKSIGTYTNLGNGALSIVAGLVELLENPVIGVEAIRSGVEDINKAGKGGLKGNLDTAVKNIYDLGVDISTFLDRNDLKPEALGLTENLPTFIPNVKDKNIWNGDYTVYADTGNNAAGPAVASEYGSAESSEELSEEEKAALDTTYSGAKEQAKNSNLATDYNAGMEKEINQAVSSKYVKVFKVMIDKEPDYIRKVLIAIPKNHSEHEWS